MPPTPKERHFGCFREIYTSVRGLALRRIHQKPLSGTVHMLSLLAPLSISLAFLAGVRPPVTAARARIVATAPEQATEAKPAVKPAAADWLPLGKYRFSDDTVGSGAQPTEGDVVVLHYSVKFASGEELGSSRGRFPLTFALGKHDVEIFADALRGSFESGAEPMKIGGRRRVQVRWNQIPPLQRPNVPKDQEGEPLVVDLELVRVETGALAQLISVLPPGERRKTILRTLFALSFLPYLLPNDQRPPGFRFGDPVAIGEARIERQEAASSSLFLGGDGSSLDSLFP